MPHDDRNRPLWRGEGSSLERERDRYWRGERNRGMFGYEGEGFMGDVRDVEQDAWRRDRESGGRGDFGGGGFTRPAYAGHRGPLGMEEGHDDLESDRSRGFREWEGGSPGASWGRETPWRRQSFRGRGPKNYQRSDDRIMEDVCERLTMDDDVDASEIEVRVEGGVVTLTGTVRERNAKRRAEDIVESVGGVREVQNQLRLDRGTGR